MWSMVRRAGLVAYLFMVGCGAPDRLVIADDPGVADAVMVALTDLEDEVGCRLFRVVRIGGSGDDWDRRLPPMGTVTLEVDASNVPEEFDGFTEWGLPSRARARIYLESADVPREVIAHEIGHSLGIPHQDRGGEIMSPNTSEWAFGPDVLEMFRRRCVNED